MPGRIQLCYAPSMKVTKPDVKAVKLNKLTVYRTLAWVFGAIIVVSLLLFLTRGWVRATAEPKTASLFYEHGVQTALNDQNQALDEPLVALKYAQPTKQAAKCSLSLARSYHTEIDCAATIKSYGLVSSDSQTLRTNAAALQAKLDAAGWGGNPNMSLTQFISGITAGADNQPDATYTHYFGKNLCMLSTTTAFSKPKPPAMSTVFTCSRTVDLFGSPWPNLPAGSDGGAYPTLF